MKNKILCNVLRMSLNYCFVPEHCALKRRREKSKRKRRSRKLRKRSKPRRRTRSKRITPRRVPRKRKSRKSRKSTPKKKRRRKPTPPPPEPPKKRRRRRKTTPPPQPPKPRKRRTTSKQYVRKVREAEPTSKVMTETTHETWVCDPENGLCHLVHEDYTKSTADKTGTYKGPLIPANDVNLLDLASGLDGETYCAVADGMGTKWAKCGTKGAENCDC